MIGSAFLDRRDAGRQLAKKLAKYRGLPNLIVLALPRGGVPVAYEVAQALGAPLDVFLVRKLGMPGNAELAMGAIATGGALVINEDVVRMLRIPPNWIDAVALREQRELTRRNAAYRGSRPVPSLVDRTVILVDDGIATGSSMMVAVDAIRLQQPARIVVAAPIAAYDSRKLMQPIVDDFVCVVAAYNLDGVARWYHDFRQTTDEEVKALLSAALQPEGEVNRSEPGRWI